MLAITVVLFCHLHNKPLGAGVNQTGSFRSGRWFQRRFRHLGLAQFFGSGSPAFRCSQTYPHLLQVYRRFSMISIAIPNTYAHLERLPMPRRYTFREIERILVTLGYQRARQTGSHVRFSKPHSHPVSLTSQRGEIPVGTMANICRQIGITRSEFDTIAEEVL